MAATKRIALVTGGMGGLGEAICMKLAALGDTVVTTHSPSNARVQPWLDSMKSQGMNFFAYPCDVTDWESCQRCVQQVTADLGPVDVLVNNAGITRDMTFKKMDQANWKAVICANLDSCFNMTKQVCDGMVDRNWGRVINISSVNGQKGAFGQTNYSAAKAGIHGFTKALALELARKGVTVNTISPGYIGTKMVTSRQARGSRRTRGLSRQRGGGLRHRCEHRNQWRPAHAVASVTPPHIALSGD
jgi:acetoacetyl-CoA reductase